MFSQNADKMDMHGARIRAVRLSIPSSLLILVASLTAGGAHLTEPRACIDAGSGCVVAPIDGLPLAAHSQNLQSLAPFHPEHQAFAAAGFEVRAIGHNISISVEATWTLGHSVVGGHAACEETPCADLTVDVLRMAASMVARNERFLPGDCNIAEGHTEAGLRKVVRFGTTVPNVGTGHLRVPTPLEEPAHFEWGDCHGHWHLTDFASYRLWTRTGYEDWRQLRQAHPELTAGQLLAENPGVADQFIAGHKQGFCLIDIRQYDHDAPPHYHDCNDPGISRGWADEYDVTLDGQFVDVTGLEAGIYVMEVEVNAERTIPEPAYDNNAAAFAVAIRGDG